MKTPQRIFFLSIIVCLLTALSMSYVHNNLTSMISQRLSSTISVPSTNLLLARYDLYSGRITDAIQEYQRVVITAPSAESELASIELRNLLNLQKTSIGQWIAAVVNLTWLVSAKLYLLVTILIPAWIVISLIGLTRKRPIFAILPFIDSTGLREQLHEVIHDRIREILWRARYLQSANSLVSDSLEIPVVGMMSEGDTIDTVALLETALNFSFGISNVPLSRLLNSLKLWFEQPKYLVRGYLEKSQFTELHTILIDRKNGNIVRVWDSQIEDEKSLSKVSDAVIYPLLFYFSNDLQANNWEALQALHEGLEKFQLMQEHRDTSDYLPRAQWSMERALLFDPGYLLARYNLGFISLTIGDYDKAREHFREISLISQDTQLRIRATYNYGVALFHIAQDWAYRRAAETFENLLDDKGTRKNNFDVLIRSSLSLTYAKMAARAKKEQEELANRAIREAELIIADNRASLEARANSFTSIGYAQLALKDNDLAIRWFRKGTELTPNSVITLLGLGEAYIKAQRKEDALAALQRAEMLSPISGYASYRIGNLYREMEETDRAMEAFRRASELAVARVALGKIYQNDGLYQEALAEFRKAVEINRRLTEAWVNIAWTILLLHDRGLYSEAETAARKAVQLERNEDQRWHRHAILAKCLIENNKNELALSEANKAVQLGLERSQAYYYLAIAQYRLRQYSQARENLQKAMVFDHKREWQVEVEQLMIEVNKYVKGTL